MNTWRLPTCMLFGAVMATGCAAHSPSTPTSDPPYSSCAKGDSCARGLSGDLFCEATILPAASGYSGSFCTTGCEDDYDCPVDTAHPNNFLACVNGQCYLTCNSFACPYGGQRCFDATDLIGKAVRICAPHDNSAGTSVTTGTTTGTPAIISFTAAPGTISAGQSSTLRWTVMGATTLSIDQGIGSVLGETLQVVTPNQSTTYRLTLNGSLTADATVVVTGAGLTGGFTATGSMTVARTGHTATLLPNGKVLMVGGGGRTPELYDPGSGTFTATGSTTVYRYLHTATLLANGKVLIAGGWNASAAVTSAELYDPSVGTFAPTGSMTVPRYLNTATLLLDGKVLVAGGGDASAELYDPTSGTFAVTGSMRWSKAGETATLLSNGKVLIFGGTGSLPSAELFDPSTGTFAAATPTAARVYQTATSLLDGKVLIAGGGGTSAERYDPAEATFAATGSMSLDRYLDTATLLPNGNVLISGGWNGSAGELTSVELYDPGTGTFAAGGNMTVGRYGHTATLLGTGKVLIAGGESGVNGLSVNSAELYDAPPPVSTEPGPDAATSNGDDAAVTPDGGTATDAGDAEAM